MWRERRKSKEVEPILQYMPVHIRFSEEDFVKLRDLFITIRLAPDKIRETITNLELFREINFGDYELQSQLIDLYKSDSRADDPNSFNTVINEEEDIIFVIWDDERNRLTPSFSAIEQNISSVEPLQVAPQDIPANLELLNRPVCLYGIDKRTNLMLLGPISDLNAEDYIEEHKSFVVIVDPTLREQDSHTQIRDWQTITITGYDNAHDYINGERNKRRKTA